MLRSSSSYLDLYQGRYLSLSQTKTSSSGRRKAQPDKPDVMMAKIPERKLSQEEAIKRLR